MYKSKGTTIIIVFRKVLCAAMTTSILLAASSMTTYVEAGTPIQKEVSITLDDIFTYVDSNNDDVINDGDIIYYGTEGFYLWDTPSDGDLINPDARLRAVTVKKVNDSTYLQDDNASILFYLYPNEIANYTDEYVNKLNTDCGAVRNNNTVIPVVENVENPEAGYTDNMFIYMALLLVAGFGCVIIKNYKFKENDDNFSGRNGY